MRKRLEKADAASVTSAMSAMSHADNALRNAVQLKGAGLRVTWISGSPESFRGRPEDNSDLR